MVDALVQSIPIGIGLMLVTLPIAVMVLVLMSAGDRRPVATFLAGWAAGIVVLSALAIAIVDAPADDSGDNTSRWANILRIVVGAAALALAAKNWTGRPKGDSEAPKPKWMSTFETITPAKAGGLGFLLVTTNPKNAVLVVAGATTIGAATEVIAHQFIAVAVFAVLGTVGVAAPVVAKAVLRDRATSILEATKEQMITRNNLIMAVVLTVIGVVLIVNGIAGL